MLVSHGRVTCLTFDDEVMFAHSLCNTHHHHHHRHHHYHYLKLVINIFFSFKGEPGESGTDGTPGTRVCTCNLNVGVQGGVG